MDESLPILMFRLGTVRSAFLLDAVIQVFDAVDVGEFPVPPPQDVLGVINVRGLRLPLIDIRRRWGLQAGSVQLNHQLVVVECDGMNLSIIVDEVLGTKYVPLQKIVRLQDILPGNQAHMAIADLEGILIVLDSDRLFEATQFDEMNRWVEAVMG
ncbi:MAG: chemotaxis protein CheW [Candidatus Obscuribacterales bacterium]|nr:chemotaxis protein CheW [Candidatus Obscuribacterales bacterium]